MLNNIKAWFIKNLKIILLAVLLICLLASFISGCRYHKFNFPCPEPKTDTLLVVDTTWHRVVDSLNRVVDSLKNRPEPKPEIVYEPGEPYPVPADIDTAAILHDYYTTYRYTWYYPDSSLWTSKDDIHVKLKTTVTQNKPVVYDFSYQWLKPQTVINNSVDQSIHYTRYVYLGLSLPIKDFSYAEIEALYAFRKGYVGAGYIPSIRSVTVKTGVTLFKFK